MESYQKIFAADLKEGMGDTRHAVVQTLSGRTISKCLFCGALTEVPDSHTAINYINIYDPTGILEVSYHTQNRTISGILDETTLPAFVLCTGTIRCSAGACIPALESIVPVSRDVRDTFVLAAADDLMEHLASTSAVPPDVKARICRMAEKALSSVQDNGPASPSEESAGDDEAEALILGICREQGTVAVDELIQTLNCKGIARETVLSVLTALINNGDCYQPKPDVIRLL